MSVLQCPSFFKLEAAPSFSPLRAPLCPPTHRPTAGDAAVFEPNGGGTDCTTNDCWVLMDDGSDQSGTTRLQLNDQRLSDEPLCLAVQQLDHDESPRVVVDTCAPKGTYDGESFVSWDNRYLKYS